MLLPLLLASTVGARPAEELPPKGAAVAEPEEGATLAEELQAKEAPVAEPEELMEAEGAAVAAAADELLSRVEGTLPLEEPTPLVAAAAAVDDGDGDGLGARLIPLLALSGGAPPVPAVESADTGAATARRRTATMRIIHIHRDRERGAWRGREVEGGMV